MWSDYASRHTPQPDSPFLIVMLPALVEQVTLESAWFLMPGSLEIIKITGSVKQHNELWKKADEQSLAHSHMRLYIASTTVSVDLPQLVWQEQLIMHIYALTSDSAIIHQHHGWGKPRVNAHAKNMEGSTIFGRRYLVVAIDKVHAFRNVNKLYGAVWGIREKTNIFIAMAATPAQTRPAVSARRCGW